MTRRKETSMTIIDTRELAADLRALDAMPADELDDDERTRLDELRAIEGAGIPDFEHGAALISEDEFEDYARELAEDIGAIDGNAAWPLSYIDWSAAADALRADYTEVELDGTTYLVRA
jgi:hypothetical protein